MKKNLLKSVLVLFTFYFSLSTAFAQSPNGISYQAVIRDAGNNLSTNQSVGMQISVLQGSPSGTAIYVERHFPTTNANGLVSIEIGDGTVVIGNFANIDWSDGPYFIKSETDLNGGANYTITGTSQLLSVPYALHAKTAETLIGGIMETDPTVPSYVKDIETDDIASWNQAHGWGDHSQEGYLTEVPAESDPTVPSHVKDIETDDIDNWNEAHGWGNHAAEGYLTDYTETDPRLPYGTQPGQMQYWNGSEWVTVATGNTGQVLVFSNGVPTWSSTTGWNDVYNPITQKTWMDRNLGASQVATSSTDAAAYGDLYQWGRGTDGHQIRTSNTIGTLSDSDDPGHGDFILAPDMPRDWRSPQNDNLWQGVNGTNKPCPAGYRLPTEAEWNAERLSWAPNNNSTGAFASPLKLPVAGCRSFSPGSLHDVGSYGYYWSSTLDGTLSRHLYFFSSNASMTSSRRASGLSVRCLKD